MRRIDLKGMRAPARVLDLELAPGDQAEEGTLAVEQYNTIWCLSRFHGVPDAISFWDVSEDVNIPIWALRGALLADGATSARSPVSSAARTGSFDMTVVICTRDRPVGLHATLESLQRQTDSEFSVLVVDNSSSSSASARVVEKMGMARCEYAVEPRPGLAHARNRALNVVSTELVAWLDDDETADADWVGQLREGFAHDAKPAAVCGVMLPAELEFEAQVRFEQYGGFHKGRGMMPEILQKGDPSVVNPLYPLPTFGSGGNMAFRTELLRSVDGFDPCLGAGTRTHSGEETRVLSMLLSSGHIVLHWPAAITWHTHRRELAALQKQLYGNGAGLSAFYASMIRSRPSTAFDILRMAPYALRDLRNGSENLRSGQLPDDFPEFLLKAASRGLFAGGIMYAYEAIINRQRKSVFTKNAIPGDRRRFTGVDQGTGGGGS